MASLLKIISNGVLSTVNRSHSVPNLCVLNNSHVCYSKSAKIFQKLGITEPPKRPLPGYQRYTQEIQSTLKKSTQSHKEFFAKAGKQWKQMSKEEKEKYNAEYQKELVEYKRLCEDYLKQLTPEQKLAIIVERKQVREKEANAAEKKNLKDVLRSLGKPKKPISPYLLFAVEKGRNSNLRPRDFKNDWDQLSDGQQQIYKQKYQQLRDTYENELKKWEDKMMIEGKAYLVRKLRILTKPSNDRKPHEISKTE